MKITIVYGGNSVEHDISVISAISVYNKLKSRYNIELVYLTKNNRFITSKSLYKIDNYKNLDKLVKNGKFKKFNDTELVLPLVHGNGVEDGHIRAYFDLLNIDVIQSNIVSSSISQNKHLLKKLLSSFDIPVLEHVYLNKQNYYSDKYDLDLELSTYTDKLIVKPNKLGSSVGITVSSKSNLSKDIDSVFNYDDEIIIENYIKCKEYTVAAYGDQLEQYTSNVIIVNNEELFDFNSKYIKRDKYTSDKIETDESKISEMKAMTKKIYQLLNLEGIIRVDYFYSDKLYVNEINIIPGSLALSLFKEHSAEVINNLIKIHYRNKYRNKDLYTYYNSSVLNKYNFNK